MSSAVFRKSWIPSVQPTQGFWNAGQGSGLADDGGSAPPRPDDRKGDERRLERALQALRARAPGQSCADPPAEPRLRGRELVEELLQKSFALRCGTCRSSRRLRRSSRTWREEFGS